MTGADFGLRPRRAAARPGISPAQSSQRSATFDPRRASVNVTRNAAPLFSPTSLPHLSHTRTVLRATLAPPFESLTAVAMVIERAAGAPGVGGEKRQAGGCGHG